MMSADIKVKDVMIRDVVTASPDQTVQEGAKTMSEKDVGLLVICENNRPIGVVTREDVVDKVVSNNKIPSNILLRDIMSMSLVACSPEDTLDKVSVEMLKYGYKRLPVLSNNILVGLISYREILKATPRAFDLLREKFMEDEPIFKRRSLRSSEGECEVCENYSDNLKLLNGKWVCQTCLDTSAELE